MARIIKTVTTTVKDKLPYHFICNYCGCRNDKVADIAGISVGGRENALGALTDLYGQPQRYDEDKRKGSVCVNRVRCGTRICRREL